MTAVTAKVLLVSAMQERVALHAIDFLTAMANSLRVGDLLLERMAARAGAAAAV